MTAEDKELALTATGGVLGMARNATASEPDAAVAASGEPFPIWAATPGAERRKILHRLADLIVARADEIAAVACLEWRPVLGWVRKVRAMASMRISKQNMSAWGSSGSSPECCCC